LRLPDGAEVRYDYDGRGRLVRVRYPGGEQVSHHYEDSVQPFRLTGTTYPDGRRSRHRYDVQGRVVSTQADDRIAARRVELQYSGDPQADVGTTVLRALDGEGRYQWRRLASGQNVLTESSGSGCAQCPPVGWRLRWSERGEPIELGDWRLRYDALGRLTELSQAVNMQSDSSAGGGLQWRLAYASADPLASPSVIDAPSVIAGLRRITEFRHNERDQTVLRVERGHVPEGDGSRERFRAVRIDYADSGPSGGKPTRVSLVEGPWPPPDNVPGGDQKAESKRGPVKGSVADPAQAQRGTYRGRGLGSVIDRYLDPAGLPDAAAVHHYRWDERRRLSSVDYGQDVRHEIERDDLARPVLERLPDLRERHWRYDAAWNPDGLALEPPAGARYSRASPQAQPASPVSSQPTRPLPVGLTLHTAGTRHFIDADGQHTVQRLDDFGRIVEERINGALWRHVRYDSAGRPAELTRASGVVEHLRFDAAGRLRERERRSGEQSESTLFDWRGLRLEALRHPHQSTRVLSDPDGRITHLEHTVGVHTVRLAQHYDTDGRLARRDLGDGRSLIYGYDAQGRAQSVRLQPRGAGQPEVDLLRASYRSDGLAAGEFLGRAVFSDRHYDAQRRLTRLTWQTQSVLSRTSASLASRLGLNSPGGFARAPIEDWTLEWDRYGRIASVARGLVEDRYGFDAWGRIVVRERHERVPGAPGAHQHQSATRALHREYFAYSPAGHLYRRLDRQGQTHRYAHSATPGPSQTVAVADLIMRYGLSDRIEAIARADRPDQTIARYRYNALGERVTKTLVFQGGAEQTTHYLYHGRQLVAELDGEGRIRRHYVYWAGRVAAIIEPDPRGDHERVYFVLGDHLGTPRSVVDSGGSLVWQIDADLHAGAAKTRGKFDLAIRFPGQYFDPESGLHDNYQRSYDPRTGRYLEPDPMGLAGGWNRYAYAGGNPLQAVDPLGLILFAFDGTGNTDPARAPDTLSNVARLYSLYDASQRHYMNGVGIPLPDQGIGGGRLDVLDAGSARHRVDRMLERLNDDVQRSAAGARIQVDVIGFSRGAAMARDFANTVAQRIRSGHYTSLQRCVSLNFIGLWDTVAQFGLDGQANDRWNLSIPPEAHVVVHALAVNEHRALFPGESILSTVGTDPGQGRRLELGFIGDHADIGGSHADGDLSDVALSWMYDQALAAGLPLAGLSTEWRTVSSPLLHDARSLISPGGDRILRTRDEQGNTAREALQRDAAVAGMNWATSQPMIGYFPYRLRGGDGRATLAGRVDMQAYGSWLSEQYALDVVY
jgi:RHS repeat-associated protein